VGLTEAAAREAGHDVSVARYDYSTDARVQIAGQGGGTLKIVYQTDSHRVLGVHALVEGSSDLIGEAALMVTAGLSLEAVAAAIHPHPTLTESFGVTAIATLAAGVSGD